MFRYLVDPSGKGYWIYILIFMVSTGCIEVPDMTAETQARPALIKSVLSVFWSFFEPSDKLVG